MSNAVYVICLVWAPKSLFSGSGKVNTFWGITFRTTQSLMHTQKHFVRLYESSLGPKDNIQFTIHLI